MKKKSIFVWLFLFITLTTFYFDFNKTSFVESFKLKQIEINGVKNADINSINLRLEYFKDQNVFFLKQEEIANAIIDLDFINKVGIKKIYPNKIKLQIPSSKKLNVIIKFRCKLSQKPLRIENVFQQDKHTKKNNIEPS